MILLSLLVGVLALFLAGTSLFRSNRHEPCVNDSVLEFEQYHGVAVTPCEVFSETYHQARARFRTAAESASATLYSLPIVENYTTDVAIVSGELPGLIIHSSGVHGVEGYAGSAIQTAWLSSFQSQQQTPTIVFVHAVNPHGMAHFRRANEHNVDLNRNALHTKEWADALSRDPNVAFYDNFDAALFNPRRAPTLWDHYVGFWMRNVMQLVKFRITELKRAMVTGQYHNRNGIFYGGRELQVSLQKLREFMEEKLPELVRETDTSGPVTWIDVHTGLGKSGKDTLLSADARSSEHLAELFPGSTIPGLDHHGDQVKAGYEFAMGMLDAFVLKLFSSPSRRDMALFVTQEFGTIPTLLVGKALILENMAYQYLDAEEAHRWALTQTRPAFYVRTPAWRRSVLENGIRLLQQSIMRSMR